MRTEPAPGPIDALAHECRAVSATVLALSDEDFASPTRCTAWDVKELLAHMHRDVDRINVALANSPPDRADTTAVTYWHSYDPKVDGAAIADRAKEWAASFKSGQELAKAWDAMWRRAIQTLSFTDSGRLVETWGPKLTLEEFVKTRVLEMTVHGLDLAEALSRPPATTDAGIAVTRAILVGLLGVEPPGDLGWDDVVFIEAGTGRRPLTHRERAILGALAVRFPLLG
jgi:uncharacterized protein (TIGR03083 family)